MALLAYLLTLDRNWSGANIRVMRVVSSDEEEREARIMLGKLRNLTRIRARIEVIRTSEPPAEVIASKSGQVADIVLLGMNAESGEEARLYLQQALPLLEQLPSTLMVWSNGEADVFA
jgi:hypothetical protein